MLFHLCCCLLSVPHYPHEQADRSPVIHDQKENPTLFLCFFFFSYAKQESCQAIVVWYGEGSWDLVTGYLLTCVNSHLPAVSKGCKACDDARRWPFNDKKHKSVA